MCVYNWTRSSIKEHFFWMFLKKYLNLKSKKWSKRTNGGVKIENERYLEHPCIRDAEALDMTKTYEPFLCPVCLQMCDKIYYKTGEAYMVLGCENCVDYMDSDDYEMKLGARWK